MSNEQEEIMSLVVRLRNMLAEEEPAFAGDNAREMWREDRLRIADKVATEIRNKVKQLVHASEAQHEIFLNYEGNIITESSMDELFKGYDGALLRGERLASLTIQQHISKNYRLLRARYETQKERMRWMERSLQKIGDAASGFLLKHIMISDEVPGSKLVKHIMDVAERGLKRVPKDFK